MKLAFGYIRVSDQKQLLGVSLHEQKEAITRYALRNGFDIVEWFEEQQTAAKRGRVLFDAMMRKLKTGKKVKAVIIHKIDRGARNLRDWADLAELIDTSGIEVHFAHESLDLQGRSGRLSADIQAVIAADYIRNLREETIKGLYGRLKMGLYPFNAPIGYLNNGKGKVKTINPATGYLVKALFEQYATGRVSLESLANFANSAALKNNYKGKINLHNVRAILHNPFYMGLMKIKGQLFKGNHEPLITPQLFEQVQQAFKGKTSRGPEKYTLPFARSITCTNCGYSIIGEKQKSQVYYRCHSKSCKGACLNEKAIDKYLANHFSTIELQKEEFDELMSIHETSRESNHGTQKKLVQNIELQLEQVKQRIARLTDALIDGMIDKEIFTLRQNELLVQQANVVAHKEKLLNNRQAISEQARFYIERLKCLKTTFLEAKPIQKNELVKLLTSNILIRGKKLEISMKSPFYELGLRGGFEESAPTPTVPRGMATEIGGYTTHTPTAKIHFYYENTTAITFSKMTTEQLQKFYETLVETIENNLSDPLSDNLY